MVLEWCKVWVCSGRLITGLAGGVSGVQLAFVVCWWWQGWLVKSLVLTEGHGITLLVGERGVARGREGEREGKKELHHGGKDTGAGSDDGV